MAYQFDDILKAMCSEVTPAHANDFQKIYVLDTAIQAKAAYDVLVSFGFEAKVYHTPDKPSKLYITNPKYSPEQLGNILASAFAYATALKKIMTTLDELCLSDIPVAKANGFTLAFVNAQPSGKQIMIQLSQTVSSTHDAPAIPAPVRNDPATATVTAAPAAPQGSVKISSSQARVVKKVRKSKNDDDDFIAGPAVGRGLYPSKILPEGGTKKQSFKQRMLLRMFGNFATSGYATLLWLVIAGVMFSFFVFAKGYFCYDFVVKKSTKWYCQDPGQISAEEARKQKQQEEQKKLGLQPTDPQ